MIKTVASAAVFCLVCLCAAPAHADSFFNNHHSFIFLSPNDTAENPKTLSFVFVNSILSDFTEFHVFYFLTVGAGTVSFSLGPADIVDVQYGIAGFLGLTPLAQYGIYGTPIEVDSVAMPIIGLGIIVMASLRTQEALVGTSYPVVMSMTASFTATASSTSSVYGFEKRPERLSSLKQARGRNFMAEAQTD